MSGGWIRNTAILYEPKEAKSDIVNALDHNCSFCALHGNQGLITELTFISTVVHDCGPPHIQKSQKINEHKLLI